VLLALLSGPLYMFVTWVIYVKVDHLPSYSGWDWSVLSLWIMVGLAAAMMAAPVAGCVVLAVGAPIFGRMFRSGVRSAPRYALAGLIISMLPASVLTYLHRYIGFLVNEDFAFSMLLIGIAGPISGMVFWWSALKNRPGQRAVI
jgi:hypothetical protein